MFFVETRLDALEAFFFLQFLQFFFQALDFLGRSLLVAFEVGALGEIELRNQFRYTLAAHALVELLEEAQVFVEHGHEARQILAFNLRSTLTVTHAQSVGSAFDHHFYEFALVLDVLLRLAFLEREQGRLRDVHVSALDQFLHVAEEERQQQRADVASVHVGVGHQNDFAVAHFRGIKIFLRNTGAERGDHGANFLVCQHLVVARFFDVEDLALQRKNSLKAAVAALFGRPSG